MDRGGETQLIIAVCPVFLPDALSAEGLKVLLVMGRMRSRGNVVEGIVLLFALVLEDSGECHVVV